MRLPLFFNQFVLFSILFISFSFLAACGHKNPLLNEKNIRQMKANFLFNAPNFPTEKCATYYSDAKWSSPLKKTCEQWSKTYYQKLIRFGQIPKTTALDDFRDPAFWKQVKAITFW